MSYSRTKKLKLTTISSLTLQLVTFVCGFILPRLILSQYGSAVNGLVNSVSHLLGFISLTEMGIGAVVQSALYKPLAKNDMKNVSRVITSADRFFGNIGKILVVYVFILIFIFRRLSGVNYDFLYTTTLILAISISYFAQYYFGVVNRLLITADQRGYIQYFLSAFVIIVNTIACVVLIRMNASIQVVKLSTSLIFLLRPLVLHLYVKKNYQINRREKLTEEPIRQKWNGVAQHIAYIMIEQADIPILTVFSSLENVSVYSIYFLVVSGVKTIVTSLTHGIQAMWGELWAKQEINELQQSFSYIEWLMHTVIVFVFGCTTVLVVPFVQVYTAGIIDIDYVNYPFAVLLSLAHAMHCLRIPYNVMILAGNHYRQTQSNYIVSATINVIFSALLVKTLGLCGVALGTLVAMFYQTVWMAVYDSKNFLQRRLSVFLRQLAMDAGVSVLSWFITSRMSIDCNNYATWVAKAIPVVLVWGAVSMVVNILFYRENMKKLFGCFVKQVRK